MVRCPKCGATWAADHLYCPRDGSLLLKESDAPTVQGKPVSLEKKTLCGIPEPGTVLGDKYKLLRVIGTGGVGVVFEAHHLRIQRSVAIKVLKPEVVGDETQLARFAEEARLAGQIRHDGIVEIYDLVTPDRGSPYIVMELLDGESLAEHLRSRETLKPERALQVACGILAALDAAHDREIIHRDVKPGNVFLARKKGRGEVIKLLDFGIARALKQSLRLTAPGRAVGTAVFMPPEQIMAAEVDPRADIYAVAAVLYLMLTGNPPFSGRSWPELARAKLANTVPPLRGFNPAIGLKLEQVLRYGLERNPEDRPVSAEEYRRELEQALDSIQNLEGRSSQRSSKVPTLLFGEKRRVAVIPFKVKPADHPESWVGEALAINLFDELASRPGQRLVAWEQIQAAVGAGNFGASPSSIAHQVRAGYALTGEVDFQGTEPRVETVVLEVDSGEIVANRTQTGPIAEVLRLQEASLSSLGRSFRLAPPGENRITSLVERDFFDFRGYAQAIQERHSSAKAPLSDELLRRFNGLVEKYPDHQGLRRHRASILLQRCDRDDFDIAELEQAHEDLEMLVASGSVDPWIPTARAKIRHSTRFFEPREALVLSEEARVIQGFNGPLLVQQATALENLGNFAEATICLDNVLGQDQTCGPALLRIATISLSPLLSNGDTDSVSPKMLERSAFMLRRAKRLRQEEIAEGSAASSARQGWPSLPELVAVEALVELRHGRRETALELLKATRTSIERSAYSDIVETTAWTMVDGGPDARDRLDELCDVVDADLQGPGNHTVQEIAFAVPELWIPLLEGWVDRTPEKDRLRFLLATLLEASGDLSAALNHAKSVATASTAVPLRQLAARQAKRLELKITHKN